MGDRWYTAKDDPIALLRAESKLRNPWVAAEIRARLGEGAHRVLDIGCGGGFLSNYLGEQGFAVTGVDQAPESLAVARSHDRGGSVQYVEGAYETLHLVEGSLDVVCAMDFLEHVEDVPAVVAHVSRLLKPGGLFFFHTFNRNPISWLVAIKGVEWFVKNTPVHLHLYRMFVKPGELSAYCRKERLELVDIRGVSPRPLSRAFWRMLKTREVPETFEFKFGGPLWVGYSGIAVKL